MEFLMTTESQDLGLTSHPKDRIIRIIVVFVLQKQIISRFFVENDTKHIDNQLISSSITYIFILNKSIHFYHFNIS